MTVDPNATTVTPTGLGEVLLAVTLFFVLPCAVIVVLRTYIRFKHRVFGIDDGLMLVGWILFMCVVGLVCRGTYAGLGTRDDKLNANMQRDGRMYIWSFQMSYCCSLLFIKSSICVTLLRIAVQRTHRIIVWATLTASSISTLITIIGLLAMCRPINAGWDSSAGTCSPPIVITSLSYLVSAGAVATDWICAILPGFMLYKAQMKRATKISISIILGLGVLASIATIIRLPYISKYAHSKNYLHNVANITLWSIFESGTGIIAGSLPSLRRLLKNWVQFDTSNGQSPANITQYATGTRGTVTTNIDTTTNPRRVKSKSEADRDPFDDAESSRKIYVTVDMEMQSLERPTTSLGSQASVDEFRSPV